MAQVNEHNKMIHRMIFDHLIDQKMDDVASKFAEECGTDMDKKYPRPNLKKEWTEWNLLEFLAEFLSEAEER